MSRRANAHARCTRCRVHKSLCFCNQIKKHETRTRLLLLIHYREERKPTNTGMLAAECLANSAVVIRGRRAELGDEHSGTNQRALLNESSTDNQSELELDPERQALLLFPSEQAQPISDYCDFLKPITLIVPDGNWRQASKMRSRVPTLKEVPVVTLPPCAPSNYELRHEPQTNGLATMEAIARAFGILDGALVQTELERVFRLFVERTLWARGTLTNAEVQGGLPPLAVRHDPWSGVR